MGSLWTNGDPSFLPSPRTGLGAREEWEGGRGACFLGVKEGKEERAAGEGLCYSSQHLCVKDSPEGLPASEL